jgi:hydroxysqualene dehydroxylase
MTPARRVLVVGGGLAGIAAALDCADAGAAVMLVEVRRRLGGAAYSFERDGMIFDNGQHVFLRCYTAYRALLGRMGSERHVRIQPRLEIPVLKPGAPAVVLRRGRLHAPLHLAGALARYRHLSPAQRLRAALAARALGSLDTSEAVLDQITLGEWLSRHRQGPEEVGVLWDLIALPSLNLPAASASLLLGAFVFQTGLLASADAGDIGFHRGTLAETISEPAAGALERAGVDARLGWRVESVRRESNSFVVAGPEGELSGEAVIVAVPHTRAAALLQPLLPASAPAWAGLGSSPIINLHVVYDRRVCERPFFAGVGTPVQNVFDRSDAAHAPAGCQYLAVSLSAAEREMAMSVQALRERYLPALEELLPDARAARVVQFRVTREHAATFRASPGSAAHRPAASTSVRGLALAGAWTDTGWPATLEGAVRSGHTAARAALQALELERPAAPASDSAPVAASVRVSSA